MCSLVAVFLVLLLLLRSLVAPWFLMAAVGLGFAATLEDLHEPVEEDALVRRVLVDEHDAVVALEHDERAPQLQQGWDEGVGRRVSGVGRRVSGVGRRVLGVGRKRDGTVPRGLPIRRGVEQRVGMRLPPERLDIDGRCVRGLGRKGIGSARPAEAELRRTVEGAERAADRRLHRALHDPAVVKAHLGLRRVHVHVDIAAREHDLQQQRRAHAGGNHRAICELRGANDSRIAHRATLDGEEGASPGTAGIGRTLGQPADVDGAAHVVHVDEARRVAGTPERRHPFAQRCRRRQRDGGLAVVAGGEPDVAPREPARIERAVVGGRADAIDAPGVEPEEHPQRAGALEHEHPGRLVAPAHWPTGRACC